MSQTTKKVSEEKSVRELSAEIEELKNQVEILEANLNSLKMKMGKRWI
jgi:prefoldin subunit 5